jgi:hypothetical protein
MEQLTIHDHWLRMLMIAKFKGNTKVADAVQRIQTVERLVHQKYVVKGAFCKRRVEVLKESEAHQLELASA